MNKTNYRVFVSGDWRPDEVRQFASAGRQLGVLLAEAGYDITCGPGSGVARYVLEGYYSVPAKKRGQVIFYLPKLKEMVRVGEQMELGADVIVKTGQNYPIRNVIQVESSDALIALTGGAGTTTEIISAVLDFRLPVAVLDHSGPMVQAVRALPSVEEEVFFGTSPEALVNYIGQKLTQALPKNASSHTNGVTVSL